MPPPVAAAGIMAAGTIGGAVLGSSAQKKAASQANASQQEATQAQLQLGRESMALNKDIYNSNFGVLSPFVSRGNVAGDSINALLGLPSAPAMQSPLGGTATASGTVPAPGGAPAATGGASGVQTNPVYSQTPLGSNPLLPAGMTAPAPTGHGGGLAAMRTGDLGLPTIGPNALGANDAAGMHGGRPGGNVMLPSGQTVTPHTPTPSGTATPGTPAPTTPAVTPLSATDALNNFANSAGMQFQLQQGANALNNLYAARGALQSGAAMKAMQGFGQQTALNNYFLPYMGLLGGQQAVGAGAASSIAGVGQNFANTAANINAGMGANIQNGANSASNAALARGAANANLYAGIGSALGGIGSSFMPMGGAPGGGIVSNYHYTGSFGGY